MSICTYDSIEAGLRGCFGSDVGILEKSYVHGGDINDSDVKAILDCFGFEIDGQFIPLTAKPDGEEQTGMSSDEFKSKYSGILK